MMAYRDVAFILEVLIICVFGVWLVRHCLRLFERRRAAASRSRTESGGDNSSLSSCFSIKPPGSLGFGSSGTTGNIHESPVTSTPHKVVDRDEDDVTIALDAEIGTTFGEDDDENEEGEIAHADGRRGHEGGDDQVVSDESLRRCTPDDEDAFQDEYSAEPQRKTRVSPLLIGKKSTPKNASEGSIPSTYREGSADEHRLC